MYFLHARQLARIGRIAFQEHFGQPHCAQRLGEPFHQASVFAEDQLRAAAADVRNQNAPLGLRPARLHAQMNQPRFLQAGNDFHRRPQNLGGARQKFRPIGGIAQRRGTHRANRQNIQPAILLRHVRQHFARQIHGRGTQPAFAINIFAQPHHAA